MRKKSLFSSVLGAVLFIAGCFMFSCQRENEAILSQPRGNQTSNVITDPCATCQFEDLHKTTGQKEVVGSVAVCQTATELTITFTVSGSLEDAWFTQTGIRIDGNGTGFTTLSPGAIERDNTFGERLRSFTYTVAIADILKDVVGGDPTSVIAGDRICIAAYAVVPGPDGAGGMVWAGNETTTAGNPNPNYFCYTIKNCTTPPPPDGNCTFTQGYWFAKPDGSQWPGTLEFSGQSFAGYTYTYAEARAIFFGSNKKGKTDAKQAFLQALALKLSIAGGADLTGITDPTDPCYGVLDALATIEAYFTGKPKVTPINIINTTTYPSSAAIRTAAGKISACLNSNHCDNTVIN